MHFVSRSELDYDFSLVTIPGNSKGSEACDSLFKTAVASPRMQAIAGLLKENSLHLYSTFIHEIISRQPGLAT